MGDLQVSLCRGPTWELPNELYLGCHLPWGLWVPLAAQPDGPFFQEDYEEGLEEILEEGEYEDPGVSMPQVEEPSGEPQFPPLLPGWALEGAGLCGLVLSTAPRPTPALPPPSSCPLPLPPLPPIPHCTPVLCTILADCRVNRVMFEMTTGTKWGQRAGEPGQSPITVPAPCVRGQQLPVWDRGVCPQASRSTPHSMPEPLSQALGWHWGDSVLGAKVPEK